MIQSNSKIIISEWSGRLGNNLIQLSNGIFICWKLKCELEYPEHKFLKRKKIDFKEEKESGYIHITRFYDPIDCSGIYPTISERRFIFQEFIRDLLTFDLENPIDQQLDSPDKLVIQMRSGELFLKNPNAKYVPSPLAYFTKIIGTHQYKEILIVCEDESNPVIGKLAEIYAPSCKIQSSDLISDIRTIANARNLCTTVGTFGYILTLLSRKVENLYVDNIPKSLLDFGYFKKEDLNLDFRVYRYDIKDYISFGAWHNTTKQHQLVFELQEDKIHPLPVVNPRNKNNKPLSYNLNPNEIEIYFRENWKEFWGEPGHFKVLEKLKRVGLPTTSEEKNKLILAIDVGACIGEYLPHFKDLFKIETPNILAFEPNPGNLMRLEQVIQDSLYKNLRLHKYCLSDVEAFEVPFYNDKDRPNNWGRNGLGSLRGYGDKICDTDVFRLDTVLAQYDEEVCVKFIKIDTEGNDSNVIKGMGKYLQQTQYLVFESHFLMDDNRGPGIPNPLEDIITYLDNQGFDVYLMGIKKMLKLNGAYWNQYFEEKKFMSNCLALKKGDLVIHQLIDENFDYIDNEA